MRGEQMDEKMVTPVGLGFQTAAQVLIAHSGNGRSSDVRGKCSGVRAPAVAAARSVAPARGVHMMAGKSVPEKKAAGSAQELAPAPATFFQAINMAQNAVLKAISDGERLLEVEFPPLPSDQLESSSTGSYEVADANFRLALDFCKRFVEEGYEDVVIAFPDAIEKDRFVEMLGETDRPARGMRLGTISNASKQNFFERIWLQQEVEPAVCSNDKMFVVLAASAQELPEVEMLAKAASERDMPVILFNLKLDVARGDLGLPAFPSKDLHFRFLSKVRPAFYLRTRAYSKSIPQPPFLVNYSGALYRVYPGPWQVLLDTYAAGNASGEAGYVRVATQQERPPLGEVRDIMTKNVKVEGVDMGQFGVTSSPLMGLLRKGYKSTTWWEEDWDKQVSNNWRL
ncbi:Protein LOW PSII ACCUMULATION 3, chloroplastic [Porphyridium purpureum]|uniref:Protein LOW PSII ACCUMULATION 3, chloroplastic n=1 Tax=Porphyridium purpureum TaxID=35688 RepID=A0A5J4YUV1_PORPP|nr:Protein LOW PSII ACCUMULATION 3, chloroplastic [Porphyridium purpureum]|eukprot:POR9282..scf227_4